MIQTFSMRYLKLNDLAQFFNEIDQLFLNHKETSHIPELQIFEKALKLYDEHLRTNSETSGKEFVSLGKDVDFAWKTMNTQLQVLSKHIDKDINQKALILQNIFIKYGNKKRPSMAILRHLIADLKGVDICIQRELLLDKWIVELEQRLDSFQEMEKRRQIQKAHIKDGMTKKCRKESEDTYKKLINVMNARLTLMPDTSILALEHEINALINRYRKTAKTSRLAKRT